MRILATISDMTRLGVVLDLESGETRAIPVRPEFIDPTVRGRAPCRPFGITWSADELFIGNNRQLLVFDKQLNYLGISATRLQINIHQLAYRAGRVWAVSPWTNSLIGDCRSSVVGAVEFDLSSQNVRPYIQREAVETDDRWHFSALLWADGYLFVAAHTFGGNSFINRYNEVTLQLEDVYSDVGSSIHGLALHGDELFWISTKTRQIRSNLGYCRPLSRPGYARGFAVTSEHFVVATSEFLSRGERHAGDSWIQVISRQQGTIIEEFHLTNTGSINDLRLLDEYDYAHCIEPLWSRP
jgi:hypothetical protein